ncbi:MAG: hypothetical protein AVDCRST_MAG54-12, partial [uncultured Actinomycetospora sp.]
DPRGARLLVGVRDGHRGHAPRGRGRRRDAGGGAPGPLGRAARVGRDERRSVIQRDRVGGAGQARVGFIGRLRARRGHRRLHGSTCGEGLQVALDRCGRLV